MSDKGELKLNSNALDVMVFHNEALASKVQAAAEAAKAGSTVRVKRYDDRRRWRVGISDYPGKELKHGTVTRTVGGIKV